MIYSKFLRRVMEESGLIKQDAAPIVHLVFDTMRKVLLSGEEVPIPNLGVLYPVLVEPKNDFTHPGTKKVYKRKVRAKIKFRASRKFQRAVTNKLLGNDPHIGDMTPKELESYLLEGNENG